jgi:hypothetical protein
MPIALTEMHSSLNWRSRGQVHRAKRTCNGMILNMLHGMQGWPDRGAPMNPNRPRALGGDRLVCRALRRDCPPSPGWETANNNCSRSLRPGRAPRSGCSGLPGRRNSTPPGGRAVGTSDAGRFGSAVCGGRQREWRAREPSWAAAGRGSLELFCRRPRWRA